MDLGWPEVLLILAIVLIVFGVGKLPQVASQMGKAVREFRKGQRMEDDDDKKAMAAPRASEAVIESTAQIPARAQTSDTELSDAKARLAAAEARVKELEAARNTVQGR